MIFFFAWTQAMPRPHTVEAGDSLLKLAYKYGFGGWEKIWKPGQAAA